MKQLIMTKLTKRQLNILKYITKKGTAGNQEITNFLGDVSRITVVRDLDVLLSSGLIVQSGKGRNVRYKERTKNELLRYLDIGKYFSKGPDERKLISDSFNFEILKKLEVIFTKDELDELNKLNDGYKGRIKELPPAILKKEIERLTIDLSWKSSQIEGNTYSLIDTEILIKEHKEAPGHRKEEAVMILNHKKALDYILRKKRDFKKLKLSAVENIQSFIVEGLNVAKGLRRRPVGIIGTRYKPLDNGHQIRKVMEKFVELSNKIRDPFSKAVLTVLMISYIQPFEDGNKRTARLLSDAILIANNVCPLSFRSVDEAEYKKALIVFYEQNNVRFFKELFVDQFKFAVKNYFL